jgi:hypothetical protein
MSAAPCRTLITLLSAAAVFSGCGSRDELNRLQAENAALRAEVEASRAGAASQMETARTADAKRAEGEAQELVRLRNEVTQLRNSAREVEKVRGENQQLRSENQRLRGASASAPSSQAQPTPAEARSFHRDDWTFAGYNSPEAALVSAIWSMNQGNAKQYFESLTQEEQLRMAKIWEGKSAEEIAAKHQSDVSRIAGFRITESLPVTQEETVLKVFIEGVNREEKVSVKRVGNEWKFNGFLRDRQ